MGVAEVVVVVVVVAAVVVTVVAAFTTTMAMRRTFGQHCRHLVAVGRSHHHRHTLLLLHLVPLHGQPAVAAAAVVVILDHPATALAQRVSLSYQSLLWASCPSALFLSRRQVSCSVRCRHT